mgnify:CR=1 FL=1
MLRPGKIYDVRTSQSAEACFSPDFEKYCTYVGGDNTCKIGGQVSSEEQHSALSTYDAIILCDAGARGCSADKYVCDGTSLLCNPYALSSTCKCVPQLGYVDCNQALNAPPKEISASKKKETQLRRIFSSP